MEKRGLYIILALLILTASAIIFGIYSLTTPLFNPEQPSTQEKQISVTIQSDGTSVEQILWKIKVNDPLADIPIGEWGIQIPINSINLKVEDINGPLDFELRSQNEKYDFLKFENSENINYNQDYFFKIEYTVTNNPIIFSPDFFYERSFTRFDTDDLYSLTITLPNNAEITSLSPDPTNEYIQESPDLEYDLQKGETTIKINFQLPDIQLSPTQTSVSSQHFTAQLPEIYSTDYQLILQQADQGVEFLEETYGFPSPYHWNIKIVSTNENLESPTQGLYAGEGNIRISATSLLQTEKEQLSILLHETIHGFNSQIFPDNVPNFWWEEGTAQYLSYEALDFLGQDSSNYKSQHQILIDSCEEDNFISEWSPTTYVISNQEISCSQLETNYLKLGYALSYQVVRDLAENYGSDFIKDFYTTAQDLNIEFSSNHQDLNNQMNLILSESTGEDLTSLLNSYGLDVRPLDPSPITGRPIHEQNSQVTIYAYILLIIILILVTAQIIRRALRKKK